MVLIFEDSILIKSKIPRNSEEKLNSIEILFIDPHWCVIGTFLAYKKFKVHLLHVSDFNEITKKL